MGQISDEILIIDQVISILTKNSKTAARYRADIERLEDRKTYAEEDTFRLGVIGITSCGKSTLINSLLGEALLPAEARPTSSQLISCRRGAKRKATVFFNDSKTLYFEGSNLTPLIIKKYGAESLNQNNKENVKEIHIESPLFPYERNMVLVDSPGLDSYGYSAHEELTIHTLLPTIDICLYIITCKDYPEQKLHEILNTIAEYDKPVIVIQNMIDSVRPSPDGRISRQEKLREHKTRLEGIIGRTKLANQELLRIVQFSSIDALNGRINHDTSKLEGSRFENLVSVVNDIFNQLKPSLIGNRIAHIKNEIERLITEARQDATAGQLPVQQFQYDNILSDFESIIKHFHSQINLILWDVDNKMEEFTHSDIDEDDIEQANDSEKRLVKKATDLLKTSNDRISDLAAKLNISIRDLAVSTAVNAGHAITLKKKTETRYRTVKKDGFWNRIKRSLGIGGTTTESYPVTVPDDDENYKSVMNKFQNCKTSIGKVADSWLSNSDNIKERLETEVHNRREAYEARKRQALEAKVYTEISQDLMALANEIIIPSTVIRKKAFTQTDDIHTTSKKMDVSPLSYNIYRLSKIQINRIHEATIKCLLAKRNTGYDNIIIGWDKDSMALVAKRFFNTDVESSTLTGNVICLNKTRYVYAINNPTHQGLLNRISNPVNLFILIDPTQSGTAFTQLSKVCWNEIISTKSCVYFVIENFEKSINGNSVEEVMLIAKQIGKEMAFKFPYMTLINHANPIYNMIAIELQLNRHTLHTDETQIIHYIKKHFSSLNTRDTETNIKTIIKTLKK